MASCKGQHMRQSLLSQVQVAGESTPAARYTCTECLLLAAHLPLAALDLHIEPLLHHPSHAWRHMQPCCGNLYFRPFQESERTSVVFKLCVSARATEWPLTRSRMA